MKLSELLVGCSIGIPEGDTHWMPDDDIVDIFYDSRKVKPGSVFVAVRGEHADGHDFIPDAIRRGAAAVVCEQNRHTESVSSLPVVLSVIDSREALACLANNFYSRPSLKVPVIGVTGTNGKTTTTLLVKSILAAAGKKTGLIGTISHMIGEREYPALHTTPESPEFQQFLSRMVSEGCDYVISEVSSHALSQRRVDYTRFVVVIFTNLTRDHLDYHKTMEAYYEAKKRLFTELLTDGGTAVVNADDPWGQRLLAELTGSEHETGKKSACSSTHNILTYGVGHQADVSAECIELSSSGIAFRMRHRGVSYDMHSPLLGTPNLYNILAAVAACTALEIPVPLIQEGVRTAAAVRGRFEKIDRGQSFLCIVDYAHSPDALERLLVTVRSLHGDHQRKSRIITVFGCGGDRDRGKRPQMGDIASRLSDEVILTSDNPRSEDPLAIIDEIRTGIAAQNYAVVPDRREAIRRAISSVAAGDVVIIAGKGHEEYQEVRGVRYAFSDREVAEQAIFEKSGRRDL